MRAACLPLIVTVCFAPIEASAQLTPELLAVCKAVYVDGSRNISSYSSDVSKARDYFNGVCSIDASTYREFEKKRQNIDSSGDTPWGLYKFKWTDDNDSGKFKDEFKSFCSRIKDEQYLREIVRTSSSTIDQYLSGAFNQCVSRIASYAEDKKYDVFQTFAFQPGGGRNFSVYLTFSPTNKNESLEISSISPDTVTCRYGGAAVRPGTIFQSARAKQDFPIDCERPTNERIAFTLGANGMSTNKMEIPVWSDPVPGLRSDVNALARELHELGENFRQLHVTFGGESYKQYDNGTNPGSIVFWNNVATNLVKSDCPLDTVLTGIEFDMTGMNGVRTPTRVKFTCRKLLP